VSRSETGITVIIGRISGNNGANLSELSSHRGYTLGFLHLGTFLTFRD